MVAIHAKALELKRLSRRFTNGNWAPGWLRCFVDVVAIGKRRVVNAIIKQLTYECRSTSGMMEACRLIVAGGTEPTVYCDSWLRLNHGRLLLLWPRDQSRIGSLTVVPPSRCESPLCKDHAKMSVMREEPTHAPWKVVYEWKNVESGDQMGHRRSRKPLCPHQADAAAGLHCGEI